MSSVIRTVAVAGASGNLGPAIVNALLAAGFDVTALKRENSKSTFPAGVKAVPVDYESLESLTSALKGQDALVSTLASGSISTQKLLIDAAAAAGVKRVLPSEFGSDTLNPNSSQLPVFKEKTQVKDHLIQVAADSNGKLTYTGVITSVFLDWCLMIGFLPGTQAFDGGDVPFSTTRLPTVGRAVVSVLQHPDETANRYVYVNDAVVTQRQLASYADKSSAAATAWSSNSVESVSTAEIEKDSYAALSKYNPAEDPDHSKIIPIMYGFIKRSIWGEGYGGNMKKTDNEMLGIPTMTEKEIQEEVKKWTSKQAA